MNKDNFEIVTELKFYAEDIKRFLDTGNYNDITFSLKEDGLYSIASNSEKSIASSLYIPRNNFMFYASDILPINFTIDKDEFMKFLKPFKDDEVTLKLLKNNALNKISKLFLHGKEKRFVLPLLDRSRNIPTLQVDWTVIGTIDKKAFKEATDAVVLASELAQMKFSKTGLTIKNQGILTSCEVDIPATKIKDLEIADNIEEVNSQFNINYLIKIATAFNTDVTFAFKEQGTLKASYENKGTKIEVYVAPRL